MEGTAWNLCAPCAFCVPVGKPTLGRGQRGVPRPLWGCPVTAPMLAAPTFAPRALSLSAHCVPLALIFLDLSPLSGHVLALELGGNSGFPGFHPGQPLEHVDCWLLAFLGHAVMTCTPHKAIVGGASGAPRAI